jgi:hypothetical protein
MPGGRLYALAADVDECDHHARGCGAHGYGWGGVEPFVQPMARSMAWGLAFAMPITLFLVPLGTLFVDDVKHGFAKMFRWSSSRDHQADDGQAADGL